MSLRARFGFRLIIDLLGLVQNEKEEVVDLVRELVEYYVSKPSTIILVTIPAGGKSMAFCPTDR